MSVSTVGDLLDLLDGFDENTPLRVATQPGYPLGAYLEQVTGLDDTCWLAVSDGMDYEATREMWY